MILVRLTKCLLVFTEAEFQQLLARDKELWATALKRGKHVLRQQAAERRTRRPPDLYSEDNPQSLARQGAATRVQQRYYNDKVELGAGQKRQTVNKNNKND